MSTEETPYTPTAREFARDLIDEHTSPTGIARGIPKTYVHKRAAEHGLDGEEVRREIADLRRLDELVERECDRRAAAARLADGPSRP